MSKEKRLEATGKTYPSRCAWCGQKINEVIKTKYALVPAAYFLPGDYRPYHKECADVVAGL